MARVGVPHAPCFVLAAGKFRMSFHQPVIQFSEITLHLVAVGSFTNVAQVLTLLDLRGMSSHSANFALSHSIAYLVIQFFVILSVNSPCPAFQPTGLWMAPKIPF